MSDFLTIAVVTATLHELVQAAVTQAVPGVTVRIGPPRAITSTESEVCLYLYHLSANAQMRNDEMPSRNAEGAFIGRPRTAIDLHYLIAFAGETQLATEILLAKVITQLDAWPVLTGAEIDKIVRANGSYGYLEKSDLAAQAERIKLTPSYPTVEEMTKLWSVFFQIAHRPALHYVASPVLLDADVAVTPSPRAPRNVVVDGPRP